MVATNDDDSNTVATTTVVDDDDDNAAHWLTIHIFGRVMLSTWFRLLTSLDFKTLCYLGGGVMTWLGRRLRMHTTQSIYSLLCRNFAMLHFHRHHVVYLWHRTYMLFRKWNPTMAKEWTEAKKILADLHRSRFKCWIRSYRAICTKRSTMRARKFPSKEDDVNCNA